MNKRHRDNLAGGMANNVIFVLLVFALSLSCISLVAAQKEKKKKTDTAPTTDSSKLLVPLNDEQQIDYLISEMLGAWQLGDVDKLHQDYGDDVAVVNGSWAPPIFGWNSYLAAYQQQRTRMQQVRMDRSNTFIKLNGTVAWACYQWDFEGIVDGQQMQSQGQTTLVFEKRNNHWVIVLNHTSVAPKLPQTAPAGAGQQPTKPPQS